MKAAPIIEALMVLRAVKDLPVDARLGAHWHQVMTAYHNLRVALEAERISIQIDPVETKTYADGTTATGPSPLPPISPQQQDAT